MAEQDTQQKPLPTFRKDLQLFQGPDEPDGSPSFSVFDPVKSQYYKISWGEALILKLFQPGMSIEELCETINSRSTLKVTPDEVQSYFEDAARHGLLSVPKSSDQLILQAESAKVHPIKWLIFHYLYIRIPLFDPNDFLKRTLPYVKPLISKSAIFVYAAFFFAGIALLLPRFDEFLHTFPYFFNPKGALFFALALSIVKVIHEFSHAYTAANFGVRVPAMGIAFLVLWPVLFTDVTDGWKLLQRRHRLGISIAGIVAETIIAALCTFGWAMVGPGLLQSVFFVIAAITWMSTLLINANPAMRFDGYYILCDLWGVDNLQSRAFAIARWKLRNWLFGVVTPQPEQNLSPQRIRGMIVYSVYTWIYRLILYTAIAAFVYFSFTKALGVFLFFLEISVFIVWPLYSEVSTLIALRSFLKKKIRLLITTSVLLALLLWFALPIQRTESFPATTAPIEEQIVYVPYNAIIEKIFVKRDQEVTKGQPLIQLVSKDLEYKLKSVVAEGKILQKKIHILGLENENRAHLPEKKRELEAIQTQRESVLAHYAKREVTANLGGEVYFWDEKLRVNQAVSKDQILGKIANTQNVCVVCFVPESLLHTVRKDQKVEFYITSTHKTIKGIVERVSPTRAEKLLYPGLASINKGNLPVLKDSKGNLRLLETYYPVRIKLDDGDNSFRFGQLGEIKVKGPKRSLLLSSTKKLVSLFWRESGM